MTVITKSGYAVTDEQMEELADAFERGEWPKGESRIVRGRPLMLGEKMKSVTYKDTETEIALMDQRAATLGMSRSDYLRHLVRQDLAGTA